MATNGVNATQKTAAEYKPENLRNAKEEEVRNTIFDMEKNINSDMENNILADGIVSKEEKVQIQKWINLIDKTISNIPAQIQAKCTNLIESLKDTALNLFAETGDEKYNGENIEMEKEGDDFVRYDVEKSYEPEETDAELYETKVLKQLSDEEVATTARNLRIPDRKFKNFTKYQQTVMEEYNACIDSKNLTNGKIAANLKNFQAKYEEELKQIDSSVSDDGIYKIGTLYDQLSSQITFYVELATRDKQKNSQAAMNNKYGIPDKPSAEQSKAYGDAMQKALDEQRKQEQANINEIIYGS